MAKFVFHRYFDTVVMVLVVISTILMALEYHSPQLQFCNSEHCDGLANEDGLANKDGLANTELEAWKIHHRNIDTSMKVLNILFLLEMIMKVCVIYIKLFYQYNVASLRLCLWCCCL